MPFWIILLAASTTLAAAGFVAVAVLWLKKLRQSVQGALGEMASHQVRNTQRAEETIARIQKQQRAHEQDIQSLIQANLRLRQDFSAIAARLENNERDPLHPSGDRMVH